jgi:hypothetical protein
MIHENKDAEFSRENGFDSSYRSETPARMEILSDTG